MHKGHLGLFHSGTARVEGRRMAATIVWLRRDLRLADHPAIRFAADRDGPVIPLFIWDADELKESVPGAASRWWLHHSLTALKASLHAKGNRLTIRRGMALEVLQEVVDETGADAVVWSRIYSPDVIERDRRVKESLQQEGLEVHSFNASLLNEPWEIESKSGDPYQVFTPYWKACTADFEPRDLYAEPRSLTGLDDWPDSLSVDDLELLPTIDWDKQFYERWTPGESGAQKRLKEFVEGPIVDYSELRNRPDVSGTSSLSPHLHFGEISPQQIWDAVVKEHGRKDAGPRVFLSEIGWREFAHHVLYHFPRTVRHPLRKQFESFPWGTDRDGLRAWQRGKTGYPIVDAGMRELWATGWMHNRVRMIVGSFLTKDLLISWQEGSDWFWDTLVDADLANNTLGWQWVSGCGADAAPYFRVFNPVTQSEKFDPDGVYLRKWVPELANLPNKWIHKPWEAPRQALDEAGIELGEDYPRPIVDHGEARNAALDAYEAVKKS